MARSVKRAHAIGLIGEGMEMESRDRGAISVVVLAGGTSDEREVSIASGKNAVRALVEAGYGTVNMIDPADEGFLSKLDSGSYDVAFIALHGERGEDGGIQDVLEFLGLPYTGSGPLASACAMDKDFAKLLYRRSGIPVPDDVVLMRGDDIDLEDIVAHVGTQCFVKPAVNGSSFGISLVEDPFELREAIDRAFRYGDKVLVEQRVMGTEITVAVLGDGQTLRPLPVIEICTPRDSPFYDYDVKYIDPADIHIVPARIPDDVARHAGDLACRAHEALGCYGLSRSDFIISEESGPVILETNTIPGMTDASLFPDAARHAGIPFSEVCRELVDLALERGAR